MNTKIISISDDQNTITHESGVVTEFMASNELCDECFYNKYFTENGGLCNNPCMDWERKDQQCGIFKLKTT